MFRSRKSEITHISLSGVEIEVHRKSIKNMYIRVYPAKSEVRISAPFEVKEHTVEKFAASKIHWIKKHLANKIKVRTEPKFTNGEKHLIWGNEYELRILERKAAAEVKLHYNELRISVRDKNDQKKAAAVLKEWYREQMKKEIPKLIQKWEPIMGVSVHEFGVKQMKTRWGTCNTRARRIWLNLELAKKSPDCLEYVVVHEMVHLLERLHNKRFYSFMDKFLPEWREVRKKLNGKVD